MDGEADFSRLEEMAMSHPRRKAPEPASLDRREMYLRALERANAQPEEIEAYMLGVDEAQEQWERFERNSPKAADLLRLAKDLDEAATPFDTRDPDLVTYRIGPVLAVVLLAKICGCTDCEEYADFYFQNHPFLSYAFELPPAGFICAGTIRLILETVPSGTYVSVRYLIHSQAEAGSDWPRPPSGGLAGMWISGWIDAADAAFADWRALDPGPRAQDAPPRRSSRARYS